jgi:EpsG family
MLTGAPLTDGHQALDPTNTWVGRSAGLESAACFAAIAIALVASLFAPQVGQLAALFACMLCAAYARALLPVAIFAFAHAGAVSLASYAIDVELSDFVVYFDLFRGICSNSVSIEDSLFAFGPEIGLSLAYFLISFAGGCGLSINGLAYVQTMLVSFAALTLLCVHGTRSRVPFEAAVIVGGILALFSFVYVAQLSRQTISSALLLAALLGNGRRGQAIGLVALATLFHLTAPLIYALAVTLRSPSRATVIAGLVVVGAFLAFGTDLLAWALENADSVVGVSKLAYHLADKEFEETIRSDYRALFYLIGAGLVSLPLSKRVPRESLRDARVLLGFALLAWVVIPLPLAATRLTLAFSAIAIGFFMFKPLVVAYPRLAMLILVFAVLFRSGALNLLGQPDQTLWQAFPSASVYPLYYVESF